MRFLFVYLLLGAAPAAPLTDSSIVIGPPDPRFLMSGPWIVQGPPDPWAVSAGITLAAAPPQEPFGLIVACKKGGVSNSESHLASGYQCVGHDRHGGAFSAGSISIYNDDMSPGP